MFAKNLKDEEKTKFKIMLRKHSSLFSFDYCDILGVHVVEHHITLRPNCKLVVQKLRRLGMLQKEPILVEVKKLLQDGFIYPMEDLEWVSPVVVTPKKNGKWRVCVYHNPLNAMTKRDHFPLPFHEGGDGFSGNNAYTKGSKDFFNEACLFCKLGDEGN